jgi:phosphoglycerate kinase
MARAEEKGCEIALPSDAVIARKLEADAPHEAVPVTAVPDDWMILDVGPATAAGIADRLEGCRTLVWNGPLGAFETKPFDESTLTVAHAAAQLTEDAGLVSVAGGGDTVAALADAGVEDAFTYVSTAGGAFLEWMEGRELPGVAALQRAGR